MNRQITVRRQRKPAGGFTLLELLVAMAIFAIMATLAAVSLDAIIRQQALAEEDLDDLWRLQRTVQVLSDDLYQLHPRGVRDILGRSYEPPMLADGTGEYLIRLSRGGWRNPVGFPRGTLQRVQYRLDDGVLIREYWPVLDQVLGMEPNEEELLKGVQTVEFQFLNVQATEREWQPVWPPLPSADAGAAWPKAIRFSIEIEGLGRIERLIEVPG